MPAVGRPWPSDDDDDDDDFFVLLLTTIRLMSMQLIFEGKTGSGLGCS